MGWDGGRSYRGCAPRCDAVHAREGACQRAAVLGWLVAAAVSRRTFWGRVGFPCQVGSVREWEREWERSMDGGLIEWEVGAGGFACVAESWSSCMLCEGGRQQLLPPPWFGDMCRANGPVSSGMTMSFREKEGNGIRQSSSLFKVLPWITRAVYLCVTASHLLPRRVPHLPPWRAGVASYASFQPYVDLILLQRALAGSSHAQVAA